MKFKTVWRRVLLGVFFTLPFFAIFLLVEKIIHKFSGISNHVEKVVGNQFVFSPYLVSVALLFLILLLLYLAGYLTDYSISSRLHDKIERSFLEYIPGYLVYKNKMNSTLEVSLGIRIPVYLVNESEKKTAILVEETENEALVFIPGIPDTNSGEVVIVSKKCIERINMPYFEFIKHLQLSGKGLLVKSDTNNMI